MKILSRQWFYLFFAAGLLLLLQACEKVDNTQKSDKVELFSYGPTGVKLGDNIKFIGQNLNKVTSIILGEVTIPASSFVSQSPDSIWVKVPVETKRSKAILVTDGGNIESKTFIDFEVPVTVTTIPESAKPGEEITITGTNMGWVKYIWWEDGVIDSTFESSSVTELKVKVPLEAKTGKLVFITAGTKPLEIESENEILLTEPAITSFAPNPVERGKNLIIKGTNLDLVKAVQFRGAAALAMDSFVRSTPIEIEVKVPDDAGAGKISLVTFSNVSVTSADELKLIGDLPPLEPLAYVIYNDAPQNGWQKWGGWGGKAASTDIANTEKVREGEKAIKAEFAGDWGGPLQMGGATASTAGKTTFVLSIFGGEGTNGKEIDLKLNSGSKTIKLVEGEWTEYKIPLSELGSPDSISEFYLQDRGIKGVIYVDAIGLR